METRRFLPLLALSLLFLGFSGTAAADANIAITKVEAPSFVDAGETVKITATVENTADEDAHHIEVKAEGFDQVKEHNLWGVDPGENDTLQFYLDAPEDKRGTHEIDIIAQSRDDDGRVIGGERQTISIDVGESGAVTEPGEGDLSIESVAVPAEVMAGETVTVDLAIRNSGSADMSGLNVAVEAFGRTVRKDVGTLAGKTTKTVPVQVSVPGAASGQETAEVSAASFQEQVSTDVTISISAVHATIQLRPDTVTVGDHVTVSGILSRRNTRADLFLGGRHVAPVFSDQTGHYTHTIIPERPGVHSVMLAVGTVRTEKLLTVKPRLEVRDVSVPDRVGVNSFFDVCGLVSRGADGEANLRLLVDGEVRKTATVAVRGRTEHCFSTSLGTRGNHTIGIEAAVGGVTASNQKTVKAVETGLSASVFPGSLTLTTGQAGVFQVDIRNDRIAARQFEVAVDGFENISVEAPGTVNVRRGQSKTAVVRVVPPSSGTYSGTVTVAQDDTVLTETAVSVRAVENPALKNPVVGGAARWAAATGERFQELDSSTKWVVIGVVAAFVLLLAWLWRRRRSEVIEPQY
ncbi:MAG: CARDB domain-containing protein [Candidatus Nanohaloarchaea archaeon]|nr:CARDB domain-containing protein [Candidatus Nanohaloarchaea archaeon]